MVTAEQIICDFKEKGWDYDIYENLFKITDNPEEVFSFAWLFLDNFTKNTTVFNDSLSYINKEQFEKLIEKSLAILKQETNENAENVIEYASLQFPELLHKYLDILFGLRPNKDTFYEDYLWRKLPANQISKWVDKFLDTETSIAHKQKLFSCLLETRDIDTLNTVYQYALETKLFERDNIEQFLQYYIEDVGFTKRNGEITNYCPNILYHFSFKNDYFDDSDRRIYLSRKQHPTWRLQPGDEKFRFGGMLEDDETNPFFHIITFEKIPQDFKISGLNKLVLGAHIREMNEWGEIFYQHNENGYPVKINTRETATIQYITDYAIKETFVKFALTPQRWQFQSWGASNSRESLFRLGGEPTWIQGAQVPVCPVCGEKMDFLMQLDTDLPDVEGGELMFGSGGICYVFWCDKSKVSAYLMQ